MSPATALAVAAALALLAAPGCASRPAPGRAPATTLPNGASRPKAAADSIGNEVRWFRASAEQRAVYLQAYRNAAEKLQRRSAGRTAQSWAVILDADETVLDNSLYEQDLSARHAKYDEASWRVWVMAQSATAIPGAAAFTSLVRRLGGRVVIVTNRIDDYCEATRSTLQRAGVVADEVLCRTDVQSDSKDPRFEAVAAGTAPSVLPPLTVLMWVGDNIQDFPHLTQAIRTAPESDFADFGEKYIALPNPMYGSWEKNPLP